MWFLLLLLFLKEGKVEEDWSLDDKKRLFKTLETKIFFKKTKINIFKKIIKENFHIIKNINEYKHLNRKNNQDDSHEIINKKSPTFQYFVIHLTICL